MKGQINKNVEILFPELSYRLNGIFFKIRKKLDRYFREKQYSDVFEQELIKEEINYKRENRIDNDNKFSGNIADFIIEDLIIIDIKAKKFISKNDFYQMKRYLISSNKRLGMIVNFRDDFIKVRRVLNNNCS
jgi:GxxExxY protein